MILNNKIRKAIRNPKKAFDYLICWVSNIFRHRNYKCFIVLTRSRTGSSMLISFLENHSNIKAQSEIFSKLNKINYKEILSEAFSKPPYYIKATGFKIFYYHPLDDNTCDLWNELVSMQHLYVIHMKRRNILSTLVSRKIAGMQDVWSIGGINTSTKASGKAVEFTFDELQKGFEQTRHWEDDGDRMFSEHPVLNIYYEDLVRSSESEFEKITDFLGLPKRSPTTHLRKQNPERLSELITNYDDLKVAFKGSEWESFFKD